MVTEVDGNSSVCDVSFDMRSDIQLYQVAFGKDAVIDRGRGIVSGTLVNRDIRREGRRHPCRLEFIQDHIENIGVQDAGFNLGCTGVEDSLGNSAGFQITVKLCIVHTTINSSSKVVNLSKPSSVTAPISSNRTPPIPG